jgi:Ca2+-binding EF-hand superfamily protein
VEEDEETLQKELKEAFRLYDKEGKEKVTFHVVSNWIYCLVIKS